jgi:nucleotide-binding universal stress UspA family protein
LGIVRHSVGLRHNAQDERKEASMPVAVDYDLSVREAEKALRAAQSANDIRNAWKKYMGSLGHRTLGRLLLGRSAAELIAKRDIDAKD